LKSSAIPRAVSQDGTVLARVVAGEAFGVPGAVSTRTPISYVHYSIQPGGRLEQDLPSSHNVMAYVIGGEATVGSENRTAREGSMILYSHDGKTIAIGNTAGTSLEVLLLAGEPLGEPVARYGPFVMNNREELVQAFEDYREGRMGVIG